MANKRPEILIVRVHIDFLVTFDCEPEWFIVREEITLFRVLEIKMLRSDPNFAITGRLLLKLYSMLLGNY